MIRNTWLDGVMGVVVGDALGCTVQFMDREEIRGRAQGPVTGMEGHGTYDMPVGTWTDDSSMTLALLDSIRVKRSVDVKDVMERIKKWLLEGEYTPFGKAFDIGGTTMDSVMRYATDGDVDHCGGSGVRDNGNGSLMRILPACLYGYQKVHGGEMTDKGAVELIHRVSGLTHNHLRAKIACGLYYFMVKAVLDGEGSLKERLQIGLDAGFGFYGKDVVNLAELAYYGRIRDLNTFSAIPEAQIRGSGYVVEALEAAIWSLLQTGFFEEALLCAVNLGDDTDSVAAIAGGLAGLYYGYDAIPKDWLDVIHRREWIEKMCAGVFA